MLLGSAFGIVEPFPDNIYPLEFTKADVTCVAFDAEGIHVPEKIKFMRRNQLNRFTELTPNDNLRFSNRSEQQGKYRIYTCICIVLRFATRHCSLHEAFTCRAPNINVQIGNMWLQKISRPSPRRELEISKGWVGAAPYRGGEVCVP